MRERLSNYRYHAIMTDAHTEVALASTFNRRIKERLRAPHLLSNSVQEGVRVEEVAEVYGTLEQLSLRDSGLPP